MKPSKIRNRTIHQATHVTRSRMMGSHLSAELRRRHHTRSVRVVPGDSVTITRGAYREVEGKVEKVEPGRGVVVSGTKKEKTAGQKFDYYVHPSNLIVTSLNTDDRRRVDKLKGETAPEKQTDNMAEEEDAY